jgi:hypothetical protein
VYEGAPQRKEVIKINVIPWEELSSSHANKKGLLLEGKAAVGLFVCCPDVGAFLPVLLTQIPIRPPSRGHGAHRGRSKCSWKD